MLIFISQEDKSFLKDHDLSVRAAMAIKLRLGEKEILEKAVKSAAANREHYRKQMQAGAALPRCEESGAAGARLPLALRNLEEEEAGAQEALTLTEAVSRAKAVENGLVNGENSVPNGTRSEKESLSQEESKRATESTKECSTDSTEGGGAQ